MQLLDTGNCEQDSSGNFVGSISIERHLSEHGEQVLKGSRIKVSACPEQRFWRRGPTKTLLLIVSCRLLSARRFFTDKYEGATGGNFG